MKRQNDIHCFALFVRACPRFCKSLGQTLLITAVMLSCQKFKFDQAQFAYQQHIKPIVDQKCAICHSSNGSAPFRLDSYETLSDHAGESLAAIEKGTMPPWAADRSCREYYGDYSLTSEEKAMFRSWFSTGKVKSLEEKNAYQPPAIEALPLTRVDVTLSNSEPYTPQANPDETRCFVIDWPFDTIKYITGNNVIPGDAHVVHHSSIYIAPAADREFYRQRDRSHGSPTDGYPCSATMGVGRTSARWIGGWLPGISGFEFPLNAGMRIEANAVVILQVHYNSFSHQHKHGNYEVEQHAFAPDLTKIQLKIADQVDLVGTLVTFTNPKWMVELEMQIPAGSKGVSHDFSGRLDYIPNLIGQEFPLSGDIFDIQSVNMHGHALMSAAEMKVIRANQSEECLVKIPQFSSNWQLNYMFKKPVTVFRDDRVYLRCEWNNTAENQIIVAGEKLPPKDVNWGDGARDEMCFGLMFVSEHRQ